MTFQPGDVCIVTNHTLNGRAPLNPPIPDGAEVTIRTPPYDGNRIVEVTHEGGEGHLRYRSIDIHQLTKKVEAAAFQVGDRVRIADLAGTRPEGSADGIGFVAPDVFGRVGTVRRPVGDGFEVDVPRQSSGGRFSQVIHPSYLTKEEAESEENNMTFQEGDIYVVTSPHMIGSTLATNPMPVGTEVTYVRSTSGGNGSHDVLDPQGGYRIIHESCLTKKENTAMPTMTRPAPYNPDTARPLEERLAAWPAEGQPAPGRRARVTMLSSFEEYNDLEWLSGEVTVHMIDRSDPDRLFRVRPDDAPQDFAPGSFAWVADVEPVETQVSTPEPDDPTFTLRTEQEALVAELQAAKERFEERQREIVRMAMAAGERSGEEDSVRAALEACGLGHLVEEEEPEPEEVRGTVRVTVTFDVDVAFQREDMERREESPEEFLQASIDGLSLSFDGDVEEGSDSYDIDSVSFTQH